MPRLMSVAMTKQAVVERRKTVTRRKGWWLDKNDRRIINEGDRLTLCEKVQGRKPGEPLVRLCDVEIISIRREPLNRLLEPVNNVYGRAEVVREGFPGMDPRAFVSKFFTEAQGIFADEEVTRIQWRYLDEVSN